MLAALSLAIVAAGVVAGMIVSASRQSLRDGIKATLDLWMAAGLLKLAADATWSAIAIAAIVVTLRHLLSASLLRTPVR
jgi:hypothetical protein